MPWELDLAQKIHRCRLPDISRILSTRTRSATRSRIRTNTRTRTSSDYLFKTATRYGWLGTKAEAVRPFRIQTL
eukprot:scaffold110330_cov49-Prasinocladus_malaysianus.AAC.1